MNKDSSGSLVWIHKKHFRVTNFFLIHLTMEKGCRPPIFPDAVEELLPLGSRAVGRPLEESFSANYGGGKDLVPQLVLGQQLEPFDEASATKQSPASLAA